MPDAQLDHHTIHTAHTPIYVPTSVFVRNDTVLFTYDSIRLIILRIPPLHFSPRYLRTPKLNIIRYTYQPSTTSGTFLLTCASVHPLYTQRTLTILQTLRIFVQAPPKTIYVYMCDKLPRTQRLSGIIGYKPDQ
jgi:hypothetical protein